jgi:hypothetical protein
MKPEKADYGDPVNGFWICTRTAFCPGSRKPDQVRDAGLTWDERTFICPICKEPMAYYTLKG